METEAQFYARSEILAEQFSARYGAGGGGWSDEQLDAALTDNGMPLLDTLPSEPVGMLRYAERTEGDGRLWQRVNASHLLGHVILHDSARCDGCENW